MAKVRFRLLRGVLRFCLSLLILSLAVFCMSRLAPGDPLRAYYGEGAERMSAVERSAAQERLGLDRPLPAQYAAWLKSALSGDWGISLQYKRGVAEVIGGMWKNTLALGLSAYLLTFALALPLGAFCALREGSLADRAVAKAGTIVGSIPPFWVALVLILVFSVWLGALPSGGAYAAGGADTVAGRVRHLILPLTVLVLGHLWYYAYLVRARLLEEFRQDYVLLCRARGLTRGQIVRRHCLRNILPTCAELMAVSVPHILGGTYVVEQVFSYPGLGTLCFESAKYHDYNLLMVLCLLTGALVIASNLLAGAAGRWADPRMRREGRASVCP